MTDGSDGDPSAGPHAGASTDADPDRDRSRAESSADPPGWMVAVDESLLRVLAAHGPTRLYPLHERVAGRSGSAPPVAYVLLRCRQLRREGFLGYDPGGYYRISAHGRAFLAGGRADDRAAGTSGADPGTDGDADVPVELDLTVERDIDAGPDVARDADP